MIIIYTTTSTESAPNIISNLLQTRLAACVNSYEINSNYMWKNEEKSEKEIALFIKSVPENEEKIYEQIRKIHPYDLPCIFTINIENVEKNFAKWLANSLKYDN